MADPKCPNCGGYIGQAKATGELPNIIFFGLTVVLLPTLFGALIPAYFWVQWRKGRGWRCSLCGYEWHPEWRAHL